MKLVIDQNNLLSIDHPGIPQLKEYTYEVSGWKFSDWDKGMIVLHKKEFKVMNLKNLGDGMSVVYIKNTPNLAIDTDISSLRQAFGLFAGFDETTGQKKFFFPSARGNTEFVDPMSCDWQFSSFQEILSFLYGLTLLYGKLESKKGELLSVKIQIPLFGQYLSYQDKFDILLGQLHHQGFFIKKDVLETSNGVVYQMSSNDWELLEIFAKWHESIEKFEKITRKEFTEQMKDLLIAFMVSDHNVPEEGRQDVLEAIESGVVKLLIKG
ncbi:TPA: hypothetical protein DEP21_06205 [Patescibacteria group bacterium]|nr:hypothetical protein [Candidatus Gracilibacteria bacterium]